MDYLLKASSRKVMDAKLTELGLLVETDGEVHTASRVSVTGYGGAAIPVIWTTKPTYDEEGAVATAGVLATAYHANVRDMNNMVPDLVSVWNEETQETDEVSPWGNVTVIDPATVNSPALSWG